ncbi:hypothetical protein ACIG8S_30050 [[Kitasatospora] papulosa]|uniref:hypothetical protein n=1 Tax=[Kitasatospora] papulosa TaxID=1464011 RepID=UPI0037CF7419
MSNNGRDPLLGHRAAFILLLGVLAGTGAGVLTFLDAGSAAGAVLAGGGAFVAAVYFFHKIIS